jgi:hypothetical protein
MRNKEHFDWRAQGGDYSAFCTRIPDGNRLRSLSRGKRIMTFTKAMRAVATVLALFQQLFIEPQQQKGEKKRRIYSHDYP